MSYGLLDNKKSEDFTGPARERLTDPAPGQQVLPANPDDALADALVAETLGEHGVDGLDVDLQQVGGLPDGQNLRLLAELVGVHDAAKGRASSFGVLRSAGVLPPPTAPR